MHLRTSLTLGLLLPLAALGAADLGRLIASWDDRPTLCKPYDPSCTEHGLDSDEDADFTDADIGCVGDCLAPDDSR